MLDQIQSFLTRYISPIAQRMSESDPLQAVAEGFMRISPITFGVFIFAILSNIPIGGYNEWIAEIGLKPHFEAVMNAGLTILALYVSFTIANAYAKRKGANSMSCGLLSLMSFLIVLPQTVEGPDGPVSAFNLSYLGGNGVICALIIALLVSKVFVVLSNKNLTFKMPAGVPPMVSESLEPMFIAIIISVIAFAIRFGFALTPYGNFVDFFQQTIGGVFLSVGLSVPVILIMGLVANVMWFFGIHPNTVFSAFSPLYSIMLATNMADFAAGKPLSYFVVAITMAYSNFGGNGCTLGLCISMLTAKSERYKKMLKVAFVPNLFNINEPLIFGMPLMMNATFFVPMVLSGVVMGLVACAYAILLPFGWNPAADIVPFSTPVFLRTFLGTGDFSLFPLVFVLIAINTVIYFPFFRIADKKALEEERAAEAAEKAGTAKAEQA